MRDLYKDLIIFSNVERLLTHDELRNKVSYFFRSF